MIHRNLHAAAFHRCSCRELTRRRRPCCIASILTCTPGLIDAGARRRVRRGFRGEKQTSSLCRWPRRHRDGLPGVCRHSRIRLVPACAGTFRCAGTPRAHLRAVRGSASRQAIKAASWRLVTSSAQDPGFSQHRESYIPAPINSLQRGSRLVGRRPAAATLGHRARNS